MIWLWGIIFLIMTFLYYGIYELILFLVLFVLLGINMYLYELHKKSLQRIKNLVEDIDLKSVEEEIKKIKKQQVECFEKIFRVEAELEQYKLEQERKYRDVVRKVLDLENKFNKKFRLLGESIIKISKK